MKAKVEENGDILVRQDDDPKADSTWVNVVDVRPSTTPTQRLTGPSYTNTNGVVEAQWNVEEIPASELVSRSMDDRLDSVMSDLRTFVNTPGAQVTNLLVTSTLRSVCRALIVLIRIQRNNFDGTD